MKERVWVIILLLIVSSVCAGILGIVNVKTRPLIARNKELNLKRAVLSALHVPYQKKELEETFEAEVKLNISDEIPFYLRYSQDGKLEAVAFKLEGSGLWAPISMLMALKPDLETIYGMAILEQAETPGLGARIVEAEFLDGFVGKRIEPEIILVSRKKAERENEVDAITGATLSSKALEEIINKESQRYREAIISSKIIEEAPNES